MVSEKKEKLNLLLINLCGKATAKAMILEKEKTKSLFHASSGNNSHCYFFVIYL
jgi:hypothetical protein